MSEAEAPTPDVLASPEQAHAERRRNLALHSDAARAGFFATGKDMLETMQSGNVSEAPACVMTGALEMAVQLWVEIGTQANISANAIERNFEKEMRRFFRKHRDLQQRAKKMPPPGILAQ